MYTIIKDQYDTIYNVYNKDNLHLYRIIVTRNNKIRVINVQLFRRYIVRFVTKIVKRKNAKGKIYMYRNHWNVYYNDLVPYKIYSEWEMRPEYDFGLYILFTYNGPIA